MSVSIATRRRVRPPVIAMPLDMGTAVRRARGDVVMEDAPDPDAPTRTIRRARAVWCPDVLLKGGMGKHLHDAAERYVGSYETGILGARDRSLVYVSHSGSPGGMSDARLAAARDWREATQAAGLILSTVLTWCVLGHGTLRGYAAETRRSREAARQDLIAALEALAKHYGMA